MAKSQENSTPNLSIFEKAKEVYTRADQAVIKATTFDSEKAIKGLKRAAVLALAISPVAISFANMDKANAANNETKTTIPTVEQIVTNEANKSTSGVSKGGVAKGLDSVMKDGKFTKDEVATFVSNRNTKNGFKDNAKNVADTKAILESVKGGKNILLATSEVVFNSPEAKAQAVKDAAAGTKSDAETYAQLVANAQEQILKKQSEQKSVVTPPVKQEQNKTKVKSNEKKSGEVRITGPDSDPMEVPKKISFIPKNNQEKNEILARFSNVADQTLHFLNPMPAVNAQEKSNFVTQSKPKALKQWEVKPVNVNSSKQAVEKAILQNSKISSRQIFDVIYNEKAKGIAITPEQLQELKNSVAPKIKLLRELYTKPQKEIQGVVIPLYSNILNDFDKIIGKAQIEKTDVVSRPDHNNGMAAIASLAALAGLGIGAAGTFAFTGKNGKKLKIANNKIGSQEVRLAENANQIDALKKTIVQKDDTIAKRIEYTAADQAHIKYLKDEVAQHLDDIEIRDNVIQNQSNSVENIDNLLQEIRENKRTIGSMESVITNMQLQIDQLRQAIINGPEQSADTKIGKKEIDREEMLIDINRQLTGIFEKITSDELEEYSFVVNESFLESLEGFNNNGGRENMMNLTRLIGAEYDYEVGGDSLQDGGLKIYLTKKLETLDQEISDEEWDVFDNLESDYLSSLSSNEPNNSPKSVDSSVNTESEPVAKTVTAEKSEPIIIVEPSPKLETSKTVIESYFKEIVDGLFDQILNKADLLRQNSTFFEVKDMLNYVKLEIDDLNIDHSILSPEVAGNLLDKVINKLIETGEYEYQYNETRLVPTKKLELAQPSIVPSVAPAHQPVPQTYSSPSAVPKSAEGHRNIPINENGVITAYNTGMGFVPQNQPQKPTQSVNSAPAAPNPPDAPRPPVVSKSPEQIQSDKVFEDKIFNNISTSDRSRILTTLNEVDRSEFVESDDVYHEIRDEDTLTDDQKNKLADSYFAQL
jgi:hypothetical protein